MGICYYALGLSLQFHPPSMGEKIPKLFFFLFRIPSFHSDHVDMILTTFAQAGTGRKPLQGFTEEMVIILIIPILILITTSHHPHPQHLASVGLLRKKVEETAGTADGRTLRR